MWERKQKDMGASEANSIVVAYTKWTFAFHNTYGMIRIRKGEWKWIKVPKKKCFPT